MLATTAAVALSIATSLASTVMDFSWSVNKLTRFRDIEFNFLAGQAVIYGAKFRLKDCSTRVTHCLKTDRFSLTLPRSCAFGPSGTEGWPKDLVTVGQVSSPKYHHDMTGTTTAIVMHRKFPFIAYEYDPIRGIVGIAVDRSALLGGRSTVDIAEAARIGSYARLRGNAISYSVPLRRESFGACQNL